MVPTAGTAAVHGEDLIPLWEIFAGAFAKVPSLLVIPCLLSLSVATSCSPAGVPSSVPLRVAGSEPSGAARHGVPGCTGAVSLLGSSRCCCIKNGDGEVELPGEEEKASDEGCAALLGTA